LASHRHETTDAGPDPAALAARHAPVLLFMCDAAGREVWGNDRWREATGARAGPEAQDWTARVHPDDRPAVLRVLRQAGGREASAEFRLGGADGAYRWMLARFAPAPGAQGSPGLLVACTDVTERREAEASLRRSEELFSRAFQASPAAISISTVEDGKYLYVNERFLQLIARTRQDVVGRTSVDLAFWGDPEERRRTLAELGRKGSLRDVPVTIQRPTGERRDALVSLELVELGGQQCVLGLSYDVTERKLAEAAVRASEERFRALVENSAEAIVLVNGTGAVLYQSASAFRILGYAAEERLGRSALELVHPEDLAHALAALQGCLSSPGQAPHALHARVRRKDGAWRDLEMVLTNYLADPAVQAVIVNYRDVTERKLAEETLRRSQEWLERAQAVAHVGSWVSGVETRGTLEWSAETLRIFGLEESAFDGRAETFFAIVHPEDLAAVQEASRAAIAGEAAYSIDHRIRRADGSVRWVHEDADVLRDEQGRATSLIGTVQDITHRRHLEEQLVQSQKMEAIGRLAGGIAHDFNNLLTAIMGYADLLARRVKETPRLLHNVQEILHAAERAAGLTRQLLTFSRKQVLQPRVLSLNVAVADMEPMLRRLIGEDVQLVTALEPGLGQARADPSQLEQVILNLAVNARDAMPQGGKLIVETANVERDDGRWVMLAVSDTGVGMDAEVRRHLFEPFFTTKAPGKGTGLGLATVYGIVAQSGGSIRVQSEPGRGTTFKVFLPRVDEPLTAQAHPDAQPAVGGSETVLVAEDEDGVRALICEILGELGYEVLEAGRPEAAIEAMSAGGRRVHLLLTDVVMPGMNGPQLAARLTALQPGLRVLYMSGYTGEAVAHHGVLEHGTHLLQKPFTPDALARKVREVLDAGAER
jgi:two-component system, cell cycle sensor histidine kinase and response regulator CckA